MEIEKYSLMSIQDYMKSLRPEEKLRLSSTRIEWHDAKIDYCSDDDKENKEEVADELNMEEESLVLV